MSGRWGRDNLATVGTPNSGVPMMTRKKVGSDEVAEAAGLMIVSPGDLVLFLKRSPKGDHAGEWCFPGGGVENDEDPKTAAVREAREETQFIPEGELKEVDAREADGVHFTTFAVAHGNPFTPTLNDEHVGFAWAPFDDPPQPLHPGVAATLESDNFDDFVYDEDIKIVEHGGQKYVLQKTKKGWRLIRTDAPKSAKILSEPDLGKLFGIEMDAAANEASHSELTSTIKFPPKPANGERAINHAFAEGGLKSPAMRKAPKAEAWEKRGGHDAKVSKEEAEYTDGPVDAEPCKDCTMFVEGGSCTKVEGEIEPLGHCKFFYAIDAAKGKDEDEIDSELEQEEIRGKKENQESQTGQTAVGKGTENNKLVSPEKKETVTTTQAAQTGLPYIDDVLNSKVTKHVIDNVVVDRNHKVPYTAGGSVPLDDPTMFIDERFPEEFEADGKTWNPACPFAVHENVEQHVMEILIKAGVPKDLAYECAHWGWAEPAEDAWYEYHGIDKDEAEALYRPHMQEIQNNPGDEDEFPLNLYRDPYPHDEPSCTTMEQLDEPRPTDEEMTKAKAIVTEFLKRDDTSHPEDVEFDSVFEEGKHPRDDGGKFSKGSGIFGKMFGSSPSKEEVEKYREGLHAKNERLKKGQPRPNKEEKKVIAEYTESSSFYNDDLRSGKYDPEKISYFVNRDINTIHNYLDKCSIPEDTVVYRRLSKEFVENVSVGSILQDDGFLSTSIGAGNADAPQKISKGDVYVDLEIAVKKGAKGVPINDYSASQNEKEVLFDFGRKLKVISIYKGLIKCEMLNDGDDNVHGDATVIKFDSEFRQSDRPRGQFEDEQARDSIAFDRASVRKFDMDGHLLVEVTNISKANICPYVGKEIPDAEQLGLDLEKIYQLLRDPEELERAAPTFNGKLLLSEHVPVSADNYDTEIKKFTIGFTGQDATFEFPYLKNSLVVVSGDAIKLIESGQQKELSCGYRYRAIMEPGIFQGQRYDGRMVDIIGNHVALVEEGRAGHDVTVADSKENLAWALIERAYSKYVSKFCDE